MPFEMPAGHGNYAEKENFFFQGRQSAPPGAKDTEAPRNPDFEFAMRSTGSSLNKCSYHRL